MRVGVPRLPSSSGRTATASAALHSIVEWYFQTVYGRHEGAGVLPFYCDPQQVGHFAVTPSELKQGDERALFRLFVAFAMFQARRDVVIMRQQLALPRRAATGLASPVWIGRRVQASPCTMLHSATDFDRGCSVRKVAGTIDCSDWPGAPCHVKDAAAWFNRMGDLGKLPTSAWLHVWRRGGLKAELERISGQEVDPKIRAELLVARFSRVRRVGRKLATMFVSALSVPALTPGLAPWFPAIDGNDLVVIDTNAARAVDALAGSKEPMTLDARVRWVREAARGIDLSVFGPHLPRVSPRLVQQALYSFCSRSNRVARRDDCVQRALPCETCVPALCPLLPGVRRGRPRDGLF